MSKDPCRHKIFCIHSSVFATTNDIHQTDRDHSYQLPNDRYSKANDHCRHGIFKNFPIYSRDKRRNEEHQIKQGKNSVAIAKKKITKLDQDSLLFEVYCLSFAHRSLFHSDHS